MILRYFLLCTMEYSRQQQSVSHSVGVHGSQWKMWSGRYYPVLHNCIYYVTTNVRLEKVDTQPSSSLWCQDRFDLLVEAVGEIDGIGAHLTRPRTLAACFLSLNGYLSALSVRKTHHSYKPIGDD